MVRLAHGGAPLTQQAHRLAGVTPGLPVRPGSATAAESAARRTLLDDVLRLYRVRDWLHFLPLPLAGWIAGESGTVLSLVGGVLGWAFGLAYTSAINQAFDDRLDRLTLGKNPVGAFFARRHAVVLALPPAVAMLGVLAWLSPTGLVPAVVLLVAATLYSAPPRLKRIPGVATVWNVVIGLPGLFLADSPDLSAGSLRFVVGLFAMLLFVSQLIHEASDYDDDRAGGIPTIATIGGVAGALAAAAACLLLLPGLTWWLARDVSPRALLTVAATLFGLGWVIALTRRIVRNELTGLRAVRLRYRYTALMLGALAFVATLL